MKTIKTFCGTITFDDNGNFVSETLSPGHVPLKGKNDKACKTCLHWKKRQEDDKYHFSEECPCFECAGVGYALLNDLLGWEATV